jgi:hypothetical protein
MELLEIAQRLRDKGGLSIIPLPYQSKKAVISWKIYQDRKATDEELTTWFPVGCKSNMAVICGKVSDNLLVLDFDNLDAFKVWNERIRLPTLTVNTGKGKHLYYHLTEGSPTNGRFFVDGQHAGEIRFSGGYVVCPPSLHPNGNWYKWEKYLLRDVKWDLLGVIPPSNPKSTEATGAVKHPENYARAVLRDIIKTVSQTAQGGRHNALVSAKLKIEHYRNVLDHSEIFNGLYAAGLACGLPDQEISKVLTWQKTNAS